MSTDSFYPLPAINNFPDFAKNGGLIVPAVFLLALVVGVFWYWRHRNDD